MMRSDLRAVGVNDVATAEIQPRLMQLHPFVDQSDELLALRSTVRHRMRFQPGAAA